jgi:colanic acid/amylovoran biosynthesis glycosyltransferase
MRVLHFCKGFSKLSETFIYDTVTELERQGIDNHVVTLERFNAGERPFEKLVLVSKPHRLQPARLWCRLAMALKHGRADEVDWPYLRAKLLLSVQRIQPGVVHAHFGMAGTLIGPVAAQAGVPLVVTFYGFDISKLPRDPVWKQRYRSLWEQASGVTVLSADMRQKAVQLGCPAEKIRIVHLARALELSQEKRRRSAVRKFVSVGRLVEKKGHESLVRAFATVACRQPEIELEIVGEGPLKERLEHLIQELGLSGRIRLRGAVPAAEVIGIMNSADAFALCSVTAPNGDEEGTPTVFVEAQMLGLPCLATWHSGIPEVVAPANHWLLAPEGAVEEIARRIEDLIKLPGDALEEIAEEGRRHVEVHFNLSTETGKLIECYRSVTAVPRMSAASVRL